MTRKTVKRDRFLQAGELPRLFELLAVECNETPRDYILLAQLTGARRAIEVPKKGVIRAMERAAIPSGARLKPA